MTDRLHQELLAVAGLKHVTSLQLQDLSWKSREQILIALFQEHTTSLTVADELRLKSRDRRLERKTEKTENTDRDVVRKNEERFRAEFMQTAATELSRLGAPAMITWQKLVFDRECCAQAFRILLTKIKSAKRSNNNNRGSIQSVRRPIMLAKRFATPEDGGLSADSGEWDVVDASSEAASEVSDRQSSAATVLPRIPSGQSSMTKSRAGPHRRLSASVASEWNSDTTVDDMKDRRMDDERLETDPINVPNGAAEISIQRTPLKPALSSSTSAFVSKLKKDQVRSLQQENSSLSNENASLRKEIAHLEAVVATLQSDNNQSATRGDAEAFHEAKMRLLQAQNMQLQRQIGLLQDAIQERDTAESMLVTALSHWQEIIKTGCEEARAAGAEDHSKTKGGKPAEWMMAVPDHLLEELYRVEGQIDNAKTAMSLALEAKLRVGGPAADFLKHSSGSSSVPFSAVYVPGIAHLRVERVKAMETALVQVVRAVESMYDQIVKLLIPAMGQATNDRSDSKTRSDIEQLLTSLRNAVMEVGAFGVVVPSVKGSIQARNVDDSSLITSLDVLTTYTAASNPSSGINAKDREKQLKTMLKQLQASESATQRERNQLRKEAQFWRDAWKMQEQLLRTLMQRVRSVGDKKMQWAESYLVHPLRELQEVWSSFQRTQQSQQDQRIHKNAYLPLLIDTLQRHEPVMCLEAIDQWQQYAERYNQEIVEIFADYDANCSLLKSYVDGADSS